MKAYKPEPTFFGEKIILRAIDMQTDPSAYFEMNSDPELHTWTGNSVLPSKDAAKNELEKYIQNDEILTWIIVDRPTGTLIGRYFIKLIIEDSIRKVGCGSRIARAYWRKGHNREANRLIFAYIFNVLDADIIELDAWEENVNSIQSILSMGFQCCKKHAAYNAKRDKEMTKLVFSLSKQAWKNRFGTARSMEKEILSGLPPDGAGSTYTSHDTL
ncbi:MAG: GNAT family N-acetyltransferase [Spirochaetes bacterium]|nr:GNAT family N-acetyltransferase [Spirochaetota bacterium]